MPRRCQVLAGVAGPDPAAVFISGGWVQRTREVIDIPAAPVEVTEHVFMARTCPLCRKQRLP